MFRREWFAKPLNASVSGAVAIKNNGCVVGSSDDGNATDGFLWTGSGTIQNIGTLGGDTTYAFGINDAGTVVGASQVASGTYYGFKYSNGVMTDTGTLANRGRRVSARRQLSCAFTHADAGTVVALPFAHGGSRDLGPQANEIWGRIARQGR